MKRIPGSFHLPKPFFLVFPFIGTQRTGSASSSDSHGAASCFKMLSSLRIPTFDTLYPDQPLGGSTVVTLCPAELSLITVLHSALPAAPSCVKVPQPGTELWESRSSCKWQLQKYLSCLTQFVPGGEDGRAQAGVVVGVCEGSKIVLQSAVSKVEHHQASAHSEQQQEEDGDHHCCHVSWVALSTRRITGPCTEEK